MIIKKEGGKQWTNKRASYVNYAKYGNQYGTPYTTNNYYPTMYKNEANHVIDGPKTESGLKQSEQTNLIAKTDEKATNGYLKAEKSIQPYQTYYNTTDYATTASLLEGYSNILLPKGSSTTYWVASRCVYLGSRQLQLQRARCEFVLFQRVLRVQLWYRSGQLQSCGFPSSFSKLTALRKSSRWNLQCKIVKKA